jgi:hypothetical protein
MSPASPTQVPDLGTDAEGDDSWADVPTKEKVLVVGAGPAGLAAAASLRALKVPFDLVDGAADVGGIWNDDREDTPVWDAMEMISSTRFTQFEDLLQPVSFPSFLNPAQMSRYLRAYAAKNDLTAHFQPHSAVRRAVPFDDGVWQVEFGNGRISVYRALITAHGLAGRPHLPTWAHDFPADVTVLHSSAWTDNAGLEGKHVLVVGAGQSGADLAVDAARRAQEVRWSVRSGHWVVPRTVAGMPGDVVAAREPELLGPLNERIAEGVISRAVGTPTQLGLPRPTAPLLEDRVIVSDDLPPRIREGRITPVGDVTAVAADGTVSFDGGGSFRPEVVVLATGYEPGADYLPADVVPTGANGAPDLFLGTFPRTRDDLVMLGTRQVSGGVFPLLAEQADVAVYALDAIFRDAPEAAEFRRLRAGDDTNVPRRAGSGIGASGAGAHSATRGSTGARERIGSVLHGLRDGVSDRAHGRRHREDVAGSAAAGAGAGAVSRAGAAEAEDAALVPFTDRDLLLARLRTVRALFERD